MDSKKFENDRKNTASDWKKFQNQNLIRIHQGATSRKDPESLLNNITRFVTVVYIDIFATTPNLSNLFSIEVNRIIWENTPNTSARIKKASPDTENSAIATFDSQVIDWTKISKIESAGITDQLAGELGIIWQQQKI